MELLKIRTDQFEGPLDLLLFLIQKHELDISEISISKITDQYLQYIELMRELNFDVASEFLVMAATLIHIKSKRLLPSDEDESKTGEDSDLPLTEAELVARLREYKQFQEAAQKLADLPLLGRDIVSRPNVYPPEKQTVWKELDITGLTLAFQDVLKRSRHRSQVVIREPTSIPERIAELGKLLLPNEMTEFASLMSEEPTRSEIVVTFIALLELARLKKIKIFQHEIFGSIYIQLVASLDTFDPTLATGFSYNVRKIEELAVSPQ
ncbi:MAG: ScpA family protein [Bacteriovoracia bacterium]